MPKKTEVAEAAESTALDTITAAVAGRLQAEILASHDRVESILFSAAREGRKLSFDETVELRRLRPDWNEVEVRRQLRRAGQVVHHQQVSGTAADREALNAASAEAAQVLATEGARIRAEIEQRQAALAELERTADVLRRRQSDVAASLTALTELLPDHIAADLKARRRAASVAFATEASQLKSELEHRDRLRQGPGADPRGWSDHMRRAGAVADADAPRIFALWDSERSSMEARVAELEALQAEFDADEQTTREFYVR